MALGSKLRRWREAAGLNQPEAARRSGVPQHQISRLEHDQIERPNWSDLYQLIRVYGVTPNELARESFGWQAPGRAAEELDDPRLWRLLEWLGSTSPAKREAYLQLTKKWIDHLSNMTDAETDMLL